VTLRVPRIYADFNGLGQWTDDGSRAGVPLDTLGSLRDLTNAGIQLRPGLRLQIWDQSDEAEDLEADAIAEFVPSLYADRIVPVWVATYPKDELRYVPTRESTADARFMCIGCRRDLAPLNLPIAARVDGTIACPFCGTSCTAAIARPA
jgi:hypothetical protein